MPRQNSCSGTWQSRAVLFFSGCLVGAALFLLVFGLQLLDVTNDALARGGFIERDIQQHYAGWLFYRQSALAFPLCIAEGIGTGGLSVAYTDSIPLAAAFCRLLSPLLPAAFQYFGWFTLLCFALQGGFAALLCGLFVPGRLAPVLGSCLFSLSPVLWERVLRHTALGAQWLVLAALYCYFRIRRGDAHRTVYGLLFGINVLAVGIHPYFVPMTYAVTLAVLLEEGIQRRTLLRAALFLASDLAATVALGAALGLFSSAAGGGAEASYGYFAMNLNTLWNPAGVGGVDWSLFLPAQAQVNGNYDAFAYLGLGVWAGLVAALYLGVKGRRGLARLRAHWALAAVCAVLTLFAVSNTVTFNGHTLFTLPLPARLTGLFSVFRSGGRMFWVPYYLLLLTAFVFTARLGGRRFSALSVAALLAVQAADLAPGLLQRRAAVAAAYEAPAFPTAMHSDFWALAAGRYGRIASMDGLQADPLHLALYAADNGMATNDPFAARYDQAALDAERTALLGELADGTLRKDTLYLFGNESDFLRAAAALDPADAWCGSVDGLWYAIAPGLTDAPDAACVRYGQTYPLHIADYTLAPWWAGGVLQSDPRVVLFYDVPLYRQQLERAAALRAGGSTYAVLAVDDSDPGWLTVTLDIPDATALAGQALEVVPR